jgi:regulator of protease activity HflC (stomatin/prohibitin superfamily)
MKASLLMSMGLVAGCATVNPGERGILFRPYAHDTPLEVLAPGTYVKKPWNQVVRYDLRWRTAQEKTDVQTNDKLHMVVPAAVVYRPKADQLVNIHLALGPNFYESTVRPAFLTAIRSEFARRTHDEVVPKSAELQSSILKDLRERLAAYGVEVETVMFQDLDYPPELAKAILDQMTTQQQIKNKESQLILVRKEQEIVSARTRGEAESRLATKEAEAAIATKDAEISLIRAKAESEAIRSRASQISPTYLKLRAIEAQEAISKSPNAKLYFIPIGKDGVPIALHSEGSP